MNVKNLVLGIGIVVVFALTLWQGIEAFYPTPQWDDFCDSRALPKVYPEAREPTQTECEAQGGTWTNNYCDYYFECQKEHDNALKAQSQKAFYISLVVAILTLIAGFSILSIEPVGSALIGSAVWAIFFGTVKNWRNFNSVWRFLLLLIALIILIVLTVRLNKQKQGFLSFLKR